jgi:hypothetical protein
MGRSVAVVVEWFVANDFSLLFSLFPSKFGLAIQDFKVILLFTNTSTLVLIPFFLIFVLVSFLKF